MMDQLQGRLYEALATKDYPTAQLLCEEIELLAEEASFMRQESVEALLPAAFPDFYSLYLLVLLIQGNLNEAKYLWKRAPNSQRGVYDLSPEEEMSSGPVAGTSSSSLPTVWTVGKALWQDDIATALATLSQSSSWSQHEWIQSLSTELHHVLLRAYLDLVHKAYQNLQLEQVAALLKITQENLITLLPHVEWSVSSNGQTLEANYVVNMKTKEEKLLSGVQESMELMKRVASYVSYFEKSNLKVDLSSKTTKA